MLPDAACAVQIITHTHTHSTFCSRENCCGSEVRHVGKSVIVLYKTVSLQYSRTLVAVCCFQQVTYCGFCLVTDVKSVPGCVPFITRAGAAIRTGSASFSLSLFSFFLSPVLLAVSRTILLPPLQCYSGNARRSLTHR